MAEKRGFDANVYPYLNLADKLKFSYPALGRVVGQISNKNEGGRRLVEQYSVDQDGNPCPPGRCCVLEFYDSGHDSRVKPVYLQNASEIQDYLELHSPLQGDAVPSSCRHRLYVLEDMTPEYVELLGRHLLVDPLVFAGQMNTWRFLNTKTVGQRTLPSLRDPSRSFTLRYPELRCSEDPLEHWVWTFAANRRKMDPWYSVPGGRMDIADEVAIVRRCASFWVDNAQQSADGWNALLLVDPPVNTLEAANVPGIKNGTKAYYVIDSPNGPNRPYKLCTHLSRPFHFGHPDPISADRALKFTATGSGTGKPVYRKKHSLFDEAILYWTQKDNAAMIQSAIKHPANTTNYVLKIVAYNWTHLLELILLTINQAEFVADEGRHPQAFNATDYKTWKRDIDLLNQGIYFYNIFRRRLAYYEDDMDLALETLNPSDDDDAARNLPDALRGAIMDFRALSARLKLYKTRADTLASSTDEIVNLRAAAKSLDDSAFNLRLAVFASIVFPSTFVAALFSMADGFRPGDGQFWVFWAVSVPLVGLMVGVLVGGKKWVRTLRDVFFSRERRKQE